MKSICVVFLFTTSVYSQVVNNDKPYVLSIEKSIGIMGYQRGDHICRENQIKLANINFSKVFKLGYLKPKVSIGLMRFEEELFYPIYRPTHELDQSNQHQRFSVYTSHSFFSRWLRSILD